MSADRVRFLLDCSSQFPGSQGSIPFSKERKGKVVVNFPVLVFQLESSFKGRDRARHVVRLSVENPQRVVRASRRVVMNSLQQRGNLFGRAALQASFWQR